MGARISLVGDEWGGVLALLVAEGPRARLELGLLSGKSLRVLKGDHILYLGEPEAAAPKHSHMTITSGGVGKAGSLQAGSQMESGTHLWLVGSCLSK